MAMYATPSNLAGFLQKDLDTYSATQALEMATERFAKRAGRRWAATAATLTVEATYATAIDLAPYTDVTAVTSVRVNGVPIAVDYTLVNDVLYRDAGLGNPAASPPDDVDIDLTYGETTIPDDVKLGVLDLAGDLYEHPTDRVVAEAIDDWSVRYDGNAIAPDGRSWREIADYYRGVLVA